MRYNHVKRRKIFGLLMGAVVVITLPFVFDIRQTSEQTNQTTKPTLTPAQQNSTNENIRNGTHQVTRVIDGDTIEVVVNGTKETVRFIGVDSPETKDPRKLVECFGAESTAFTRIKLEGQTVGLMADSTQGNHDKYGRLLRYVFLSDGTHINKLLIQEGYAHEYTYRLPYQYQEEFKLAQQQAREHKKGLWADSICEN